MKQRQYTRSRRFHTNNFEDARLSTLLHSTASSVDIQYLRYCLLILQFLHHLFLHRLHFLASLPTSFHIIMALDKT